MFIVVLSTKALKKIEMSNRHWDKCVLLRTPPILRVVAYCAMSQLTHKDAEKMNQIVSNNNFCF